MKTERKEEKRGRRVVETTMARQHAHAAPYNGRAPGTVKAVSTVNRGPFRGVAERGDTGREIQTTSRETRDADREPEETARPFCVPSLWGKTASLKLEYVFVKRDGVERRVRRSTYTCKWMKPQRTMTNDDYFHSRNRSACMFCLKHVSSAAEKLFCNDTERVISTRK